MSSNQFLHLLVVVLCMVPASLLAQDEGCADSLACNFDADVPDSLSTGCEFLSCRDHGDPVHWTYCYGNNADLVFTLHNPSGSDIVLELNNDLPSWSWGASIGDHLTIHDGADTEAPVIYDSDEDGALVDGVFVVSTGSVLTLNLETDASLSCAAGDAFQLDMLVYGADVPVVGCMDDKACNYDANAVLEDVGDPCEFLSCRNLGDPTPWIYCFGNNMDEVFTITNPDGAQVVLELYNDLQSYPWLASIYDHFRVYDGPTEDAPMIYNSQNDNSVIDGAFVVSTGTSLTLELQTNSGNSCATGGDFQLDMLIHGAAAPIVGCDDGKACNYNAQAVLEDYSVPCEFLSCRNLGDPTDWTYCFGNNMDEEFTVSNPVGEEIILVLNNNLQTFPWLASIYDHFRVYDGPDTDAPKIYDSQNDNAVQDSTYVVSSGSTLTLTLQTNHGGSCAMGDEYVIDMLLFGAPAPIVGCTDPVACNFNACAILDESSTTCTYLDCRAVGDGMPFTYCYGDDEDTAFVFTNPSGGEVLLELFNALPTFPWLSTTYDHFRVYDGPDFSAPLIYSSQIQNAVIDGTMVVSTNDTIAVRVTSNGFTSCASGADFGISFTAYTPAPGTPCADVDGDGICDDQEIHGCTYPNALNFPGCATEDDGSCFFPQATCPSDFNLDWVISIQDVLTLLSAFGMTCPGYEVGTELADCTYAEALNYNADALTDDGSCIFESPCTGDVNGDGTVTVSDLLSLMTVYSTSCE